MLCYMLPLRCCASGPAFLGNSRRSIPWGCGLGLFGNRILALGGQISNIYRTDGRVDLWAGRTKQPVRLAVYTAVQSHAHAHNSRMLAQHEKGRKCGYQSGTKGD